MCVTSCGRGVYAFGYEGKKPVVAGPEKYMVGCTTCATICLQDAIEFPYRGHIRGVVRTKRLLRQAKDTLQALPENFDIRPTRPQDR